VTLCALRDALPAARVRHFLNYAATAPMLAPGAELMADIAREGTEPLSEHFNAWLARVESARRTIADMIGARPDDVAFTTGTSAALSIAAGAVRWQPGDRVLYPANAFPSNRYVWQNLPPGVVAEPIAPQAGARMADQLATRDLTSVRLVALSAVCYRDGRRTDVRAVVDRCSARGICVAVDAAQAVGAIDVDVRAWGCDFLACSRQKWLLGPVGTGFLYVAPQRLAELRVPLVGWASARDVGDFLAERLVFCDTARRFEPGLPDVAAIAALGKSVELLSAAGWPNVFARIAEHNARLRGELRRLGLHALNDAPLSEQAGIVTVSMADDAEAEAVEADCRRGRILIRRFGDLLRFSAHATTADADIDALLRVLRRYRRPLGKLRTPSAPVPGKPQRPEGRRWRRALVTGASRGLGAAIAKTLARRGCDLALVGRDAAALESVAEHIRSSWAVRAEALVLDLADADAVGRWLGDSGDSGPDYDVLVNAAAVTDARLFLDTDPDWLRGAFEANFFAPVALARRLLPGMLRRGHGAILNAVATGARCAMPLLSACAATKGALWAWSEALTREVTGSGVTVTTFVPPHMPTPEQRNLARKALAYYRMRDGAGPRASPRVVAEEAIAALAAGRAVVVPLTGRIRLAANALAPGLLAGQIRRLWRRPSRWGGNSPDSCPP